MKKVLISTLSGFVATAGLALTLGMGVAHAGGDPSCAGGDAVSQQLPIGVVCANGDPTNQTGYVYADGNPSNPGALAGYIGVNSSEGVVGCANGNYNDTDPQGNAVPRNVIAHIPPTAQDVTNLQNAQGNSCTPAPPA